MTAPYRYTVQVQFITTRQVKIESDHDLTCGEIHKAAVEKAEHDYNCDAHTIINTGAIECVSAPGKEPSA